MAKNRCSYSPLLLLISLLPRRVPFCPQMQSRHSRDSYHQIVTHGAHSQMQDAQWLTIRCVTHGGSPSDAGLTVAHHQMWDAQGCRTHGGSPSDAGRTGITIRCGMHRDAGCMGAHRQMGHSQWFSKNLFSDLR